MASFLSALVSGYAGKLIQKHKEERDREDKEKQAELQLIQTAMASGQLTPDQMNAAFSRSEEILQEYGGKGKKNGISLANLVGRFSDTNQNQKAPAAAPQRGAAPATPQPKVNLSAPPSRGTFSPTFQSQANVISQNDLAAARAKNQAATEEQKAEIKSASEAYMKAFPKATQADLFNNVVAPMYGIKPPVKSETKKIQDLNSLSGWSWITRDTTTGQQIGAIQTGAPPPSSERPTTGEQRKQEMINDYMELTGKSQAEATQWYDSQIVKQMNQKGEPTTSTSTTVQTTPQGPAITQQTTTTRGKGGAQALGVGQNVLTPNGTPKHTELSWAVPKEGRTAIRKAQDAYEDANARYTVMKDTLAKIQKDPQAAGQGDILILSNHIGMTWSAQKGGRIPITIWNEARKSRPFLQGVQVKLEGGFVTGAILTPQQRQYMIDLADEQRRVAQTKVLDEDVRYGVKYKVMPTKGPNAGQVGYISREEYDANPGIYKKVP